MSSVSTMELVADDVQGVGLLLAALTEFLAPC
jgi:hypothetical protein